MDAMRFALLFTLIAPALVGQRLPFEGCTIVARQSLPDGVLRKWYGCDWGAIEIAGQWREMPNGRHEFGDWFSGEYVDFGMPPKVIAASFTYCEAGLVSGNYRGYMTAEQEFSCKEGPIAIRGSWGEEYQGNWSYTLRFGEVTMKPQWVDDVRKQIDFVSSFQRWCPTKYGFRLCGFIEQPKEDHGPSPRFRR